MIVPDKIAPEIGWRTWRPWGLYREVSLRGPQQVWPEHDWMPGRRMDAWCLNDSEHSAPEAACNCGFHAAKSSDLLIENYVRGVLSGWCVIGEVKLWGRVVEGEWGFRAQYAYPHSFYVVGGYMASGHFATAPDGAREQSLLDHLAEFDVPAVKCRSLAEIAEAADVRM